MNKIRSKYLMIIFLPLFASSPRPFIHNSILEKFNVISWNSILPGFKSPYYYNNAVSLNSRSDIKNTWLNLNLEVNKNKADNVIFLLRDKPRRMNVPDVNNPNLTYDNIQPDLPATNFSWLGMSALREDTLNSGSYIEN